MVKLHEYLRSREVAALLAEHLGERPRAAGAVRLCRAAGVPSIRIGGALLWSRGAVHALLGDLRASRDRAARDGRRP